MATTWLLDPMHSSVQFKIKHLVISTVTGGFRTFTGTARTVGDDFTRAQVEVSILVDSLNTNQEQRDQHLRAEEFFNATKYAFITFRSTAFTSAGAGNYQLTGDLTIKAVTRPITLAVTYGGTAIDYYGSTKAGFEATGTLNRHDFGLTWGGTTQAGTIVVGEEVQLLLSVQFEKQ